MLVGYWYKPKTAKPIKVAVKTLKVITPLVISWAWSCFIHVLVAYAKLRPLSSQDGSPKKAREDFLTEATIMGQFDDNNVIYLHGVVSKCEWVELVGGT